MKEIPITKTLLRKGLNSRPFRTQIINYNKLYKKFNPEKIPIDIKIQKESKKINFKKTNKESKEEEREIKKAIRELKYVEKRNFFRWRKY